MNCWWYRGFNARVLSKYRSPVIQSPRWYEWCGSGAQLNVAVGRWNTLMFGSAFPQSVQQEGHHVL